MKTNRDFHSQRERQKHKKRQTERDEHLDRQTESDMGKERQKHRDRKKEIKNAKSVMCLFVWTLPLEGAYAKICSKG